MNVFEIIESIVPEKAKAETYLNLLEATALFITYFCINEYGTLSKYGVIK